MPRRQDATTGDALGAALGALAAGMRARVPAARADEADAVHRLRTGVRRLRSTLAAFRPCLDAEAVASMRALLAEAGEALGGPRDLEVRAELAQQILDELRSTEQRRIPREVSDRLVQEMAEKRRDAHRELVAWWDEQELGLSASSDAWAAAPPVRADVAGRRARPVMKQVLRAEMKRTLKAARGLDFEGIAAAEETAVAEAHRLRKAARRLRHVAEATTRSPVPVLGKKARRAGRRGEQLQSVLGEHRDALLLARHARQLAEETSTDRSAAGFRAVAEAADRRAAAAVAELPQALDRLRSAATSLGLPTRHTAG